MVRSHLARPPKKALEAGPFASVGPNRERRMGTRWGTRTIGTMLTFVAWIFVLRTKASIAGKLAEGAARANPRG
jgi:hypothetical protein